MSNFLSTDNIIVGLLKNMLRKNISFHQEGFMVKDEISFKIKLIYLDLIKN